MMRTAYRVVIPALLLVVTLVWFIGRLHLLPTQESVSHYVKQLSDTLGEDTVILTSQTISSAASAPSTAFHDHVQTSSTGYTSDSEPPIATPDASQTSATGDVSDAKQTSESTTLASETSISTADSRDKIIVMGKLKIEDTDWVSKLPDWQTAIYHVDEAGPPISNEPYLVTPNKGHEADPYLTYIIDNYNNLPSTMAFVHSHEKGWPRAWHTDATGYSNVNSLRTLNINFVQKNGYANLRCVMSPGCPAEVQPFRDGDDDRTTEHAYAEAWKHVFGNNDVPEVIATPCCAQFAVSRKQVLERPREFYIDAREWLLETELDDATSGRVFEYMWHIIFGRDPVYCPSLSQCYHDVYQKQVFKWRG
ncbi:hypothetical protein BDV97DRAFT_38834 [Delphinella strobiligena]|nr:hypothetical protein BDV97DRAFT_38834 [Delphinella strobiligena]